MTLVVSDSSPLIALSQIGQLKLLHDLFGELVVPDAVAREVEPRMSLPSWITPRPLAMRVGLDLLYPKLGLGESEAIILAHLSEPETTQQSSGIASSCLLIHPRVQRFSPPHSAHGQRERSSRKL